MMMETGYLLDNILSFVAMMRTSGISVSTEQTMNLMQALTWIDIGEREQVYYAARDLLINRYEHLRLFDVLFNRFWRNQAMAVSSNSGTQKTPHAPRHDRKHHQPLLMSYLGQKANANDPEIEVGDKSGTFSNLEMIQQKNFSDMSEIELQTVREVIQAMRWGVSLRETRRYTPTASGERLHLRKILSDASRTGGVPLTISYQSRKIKQRPIVLIADISGSMEKYTRLVLQFFYCMSHSIHQVESFVFGTRLTRITPQLKLKNVDRAIDQAAREVVDWSGGTRIGESLHEFNRKWSKRVLRRGAIVVIVSDGWERDNADLLQKEMRYLQLRCHRLIWMNPLSGRSTYEPLVSGMQAALRYIDDFLPIHNLQSLRILAEHLMKLNIRRSNVFEM